MANRRTGGANVPIEGKIGRAAPTASSGGGVLTGAHMDDRMPATGMDEDIPFETIEPVEDSGAEPIRQP